MSDFETAIENVVMWMSLAKPKTHGFGGVPLRYFDGALPVLTSTTPAGADDRFLIPMDATLDDVGGRLDQSALFPFTDEPGAPAGTQFMMQRWQEVRNRRRLPGWIPGGVRFGPLPVIECAFGCVNASGKGVTGTRYLQARGRSPFTRSDGGTGYITNFVDVLPDGGSGPELFRVQRQACLGLQFVRPFTWWVRLAIDAGPAVSIPTDPSGAAEVFKLRDVPPGKKRRSALLHWVRGHWRMDRSGDGLHEVRKHMRGQTVFTWNGMRCQLSPSDDDLRELGLARAAADRRKSGRRRAVAR
jgi:hypothetical protein